MYMHLKVYLTSTDCQVMAFTSSVEARGRPLPMAHTLQRLKGV